ncbi:glycosyltransferase family 4 protein [Gemmata sp. JC673]|uniref:Glycosyltransferase family 4 protein n=1 Tax=Gemmata algarum TaxID=2975278 RepID=A0ABU5ETM5_9BACT|nr:glycosyltransferase family 4 protein [Gemmata algarum]MDY3558323.1 glycosyltransferase family 4 protein [Gemmata algarum]
MTHWAILTGEYPPQFGGVADYTQLVARGLAAAGDAVTVFAPRCSERAAADPGVEVVRLPDHFGPRGLPALDGLLARARPDRILVQYVPHAFGYKALNLPFAAWVALRARRVAPVWVMFHEVAFPFAWRYPHLILGTANAAMARLVAGAADRVLVSVPQWAGLLRRLCPRARPAEWVPVPSNVPQVPGERKRGADGRVTVGHFGTYGPAVAPLLEPALARLLAPPGRAALLLGRGAGAFARAFGERHPALAGQVVALGELPGREVAEQFCRCDVLLQPYMDGLSCRRGSVMAGLANGVPVVSNWGEGSEPLWAAEGAGCVALAPSASPDALVVETEALLALPTGAREEIGRRGAELYRKRFSLANTLEVLRAR